MLVPGIYRRLGGGAKHGDDLHARAFAASAIACLNATIDTWTAGDARLGYPHSLTKQWAH